MRLGHSNCKLTFWLLTLVMSLNLLAPCGRAEELPAEYRVKAAFLQRFLMFINWPEDDGAAGAPIIVGVVGDTPLAAALRALQGEQARGRTFEVLQDISPDEMAAQCHVVFIPAEIGHLKRTEHPQWQNLRWLEDRAVLTIGEDEDFLDAGGVINFYLEDQRVRFAISSGAAKRARLSIRADLMRLAKVVD